MPELKAMREVGREPKDEPYHIPNAPVTPARSSNNNLSQIAVPLILISGCFVLFILVMGKEILVPFVVSIFFAYLLRPLVRILTTPYFHCCTVRQDNRCVHCAPYILRRHEPKEKRESMNEDPTMEREMNLHQSQQMMLPVLSDDEEEESLLQYEYYNPPPPKANCQTWLGHRRCPRPLAVLLALMVALGAVVGMSLIVIDAVQDFERNHMETYEEQAKVLAKAITAWTYDTFKIDGSALLGQIKAELPLSSMLKNSVMYAVGAVSDMFWILLFVVYLLLEHQDQPNKLRRGISSKANLRIQIDQQIQRYIVIKTLISGGVGLAVYILYGPVLGIIMANIFGLLTFLLNYIPNVGPLVATLLPIPLIVLDPDLSTVNMILAIVLPIVVHAVVGNVIEPKVFGDSLELHPVVVLLSLAFWFSIWGSAGAILSVPITAVFRIIVSQLKSPHARVVAYLLEGKLDEAFR